MQLVRACVVHIDKVCTGRQPVTSSEVTTCSATLMLKSDVYPCWAWTLYAVKSVRANHGEQSMSEASATSKPAAPVSVHGCLLNRDCSWAWRQPSTEIQKYWRLADISGPMIYTSSKGGTAGLMSACGAHRRLARHGKPLLL